MPDVDSLVLSAVSGVVANCWAVELPPDPVFPAAVFEVDSEPESGWVSLGVAVRTLHTVTVVVMARERGVCKTLSSAVRDALENQENFVETKSFGDADYERDASVFAKYLTIVFRT
jgi:hypothetical protein